MKAKCFPTESKDKDAPSATARHWFSSLTQIQIADDARRIIAAGGFNINHQRCTDYTEILSLERHILSNGITVIRVGKQIADASTCIVNTISNVARLSITGKKNYSIVKWLQ